MSTQHWKGGIIPAPGDDLLPAWPKFADTAGIYIRASTQAAALAMISAALIADATAITTTNPAVFLINGVFFWADGTKASGAYQLKPVGAVSGILHQVQDTYNGAGAASTDLYVEGEGTIIFALDTLVEFYLEECVSGVGDAQGSVLNGFRVDGADIFKTVVAYDQFYSTKTVRWVAELTAGSHTVAYTTQKKYGAAPAYHYSGGAYQGRRFTVTSLGIAA